MSPSRLFILRPVATSLLMVAVVILAEHDGRILLVEQPRVPTPRRSSKRQIVGLCCVHFSASAGVSTGFSIVNWACI